MEFIVATNGDTLSSGQSVAHGFGRRQLFLFVRSKEFLHRQSIEYGHSWWTEIWAIDQRPQCWRRRLEWVQRHQQSHYSSANSYRISNCISIFVQQYAAFCAFIMVSFIDWKIILFLCIRKCHFNTLFVVESDSHRSKVWTEMKKWQINQSQNRNFLLLSCDLNRKKSNRFGVIAMCLSRK